MGTEELDDARYEYQRVMLARNHRDYISFFRYKPPIKESGELLCTPEDFPAYQQKMSIMSYN